MNSRATFSAGKADVCYPTHGFKALIRYGGVLAVVTASLMACSKSTPLQLITLEESKMAASRSAVVEVNDGPRILIEKPNPEADAVSPFPIKVTFDKGQLGSNVNMESLKLTYQKMWGIDITDRVRDYIYGNRIDVPEVELPAGKHTIKIYIEDEEKRSSVTAVSINVLSE